MKAARICSKMAKVLNPTAFSYSKLIERKDTGNLHMELGRTMVLEDKLQRSAVTELSGQYDDDSSFCNTNMLLYVCATMTGNPSFFFSLQEAKAYIVQFRTLATS